jgi:hypothetical protein
MSIELTVDVVDTATALRSLRSKWKLIGPAADLDDALVLMFSELLRQRPMLMP